MFIAFTNHIDETIVTNSKHEAECIRDYFTNGGRDLDDYDRIEMPQEPAIVVQSSVSLG